MDKVYGNDMQTKCAWCLTAKATKEYIGLMAGEEYVLYQVCNKCFEDKPNEAWLKYIFVCDPDECDTLIEVTCKLPFDFPNGEVAMTCPCGRKMQWTTTEKFPTLQHT